MKIRFLEKIKIYLLLLVAIFTTTLIILDLGHISFGVNGVIKEGLKTTILESGIFPSNAQTDTPLNPYPNLGSSLSTAIFVSTKDIGNIEIYKNILYGFFSQTQELSAEQFFLNCSIWVILIAILFLFFCRKPSRFFKVSLLLIIASFSAYLSFRLSQGWDEFFINLRHAYIWSTDGKYSINSKEMTEATVDFLPLALTTGLSFFGFKLIDGFILTSILGNFVLVFITFAFSKKITDSNPFSIIAAILIGTYPSVIWVGATGFSAVLFSAWIFSSIYFYTFSNNKILGIFFLSTLCLVRTEGILFAVMWMFFDFFYNISSNKLKSHQLIAKRSLVPLLAIMGIFLLSSTIRKYFFGMWLPNPIIFKNTGLDKFYLWAGIEQFLEISSYFGLGFIALGIFTGYLALSFFKNNSKEENYLLASCLIIFMFVVPYFSGGGDWFPVLWNRYAMPLNLIMLFTLMIFSYLLVYKILNSTRSFLYLLIPLGLMSILMVIDFRVYKDLYVNLQSQGSRWNRIDDLASLGQFLKASTPKESLISSPEEATIMYFSEREMLGLLGVSNKDMLRMPLQPIREGDLLHRRRGIDSIYLREPDVIALWEPIIRGTFHKELKLIELREIVQNNFFDQFKVDVAYYRVGSYDFLLSMGYEHYSIFLPDKVFSIFIRAKIKKDFEKYLLSQGFIFNGHMPIKYSVSSSLMKMYSPYPSSFNYNFKNR